MPPRARSISARSWIPTAATSRSSRTRFPRAEPPAPAMHDLKPVRERPDDLREAIRRRNALAALGPQLDRCEALERERRVLIQAVEERKAARNAGSQDVARRKKAGEPADDLIAYGR